MKVDSKLSTTGVNLYIIIKKATEFANFTAHINIRVYKYWFAYELNDYSVLTFSYVLADLTRSTLHFANATFVELNTLLLSE